MYDQYWTSQSVLHLEILKPAGVWCMHKPVAAYPVVVLLDEGEGEGRAPTLVCACPLGENREGDWVELGM